MFKNFKRYQYFCTTLHACLRKPEGCFPFGATEGESSPHTKMQIKCSVAHKDTWVCVCVCVHWQILTPCKPNSVFWAHLPVMEIKKEELGFVFHFLDHIVWGEGKKKLLLWLCFFDFYLLTEVPYGICKGETVCTMQWIILRISIGV